MDFQIQMRWYFMRWKNESRICNGPARIHPVSGMIGSYLSLQTRETTLRPVDSRFPIRSNPNYCIEKTA